MIFHYLLLNRKQCHLWNKYTELDVAAIPHGKFPSSDCHRSTFNTNKPEVHHSRCVYNFHIFPPKTLRSYRMQNTTFNSFFKLQTMKFYKKGTQCLAVSCCSASGGWCDWAKYISETWSQQSFNLVHLIYWINSQLTSLSREASRCSLLGLIIKSLLTSTDGCSPCLLGAYIIFLIASRTEFLSHN